MQGCLNEFNSNTFKRTLENILSRKYGVKVVITMSDEEKSEEKPA